MKTTTDTVARDDAYSPLFSAKANNPWDALSTYNYGDDRTLLSVIEHQCFDASPAEALTLEDDLLETLAEKNITAAAIDFICRQLRLVGSEKCIPALAPLLTNPTHAHHARLVLETLPYPAATTALTSALAKTPATSPEHTALRGSLALRKRSEP
jgi:hypothetical protein